jgi:hypothetical protein
LAIFFFQKKKKMLLHLLYPCAFTKNRHATHQSRWSVTFSLSVYFLSLSPSFLSPVNGPAVKTDCWWEMAVMITNN